MEMKKEYLLYVIIAVLIVTNVLTYTLVANRKDATPSAKLASVGDVAITEAALAKQMKRQYGDEVLQQLIDREVVKQVADKYNVTVTDNELTKEIALLKTLDRSLDNSLYDNEKQWQAQVKNNLLLEKLLTRDVVIDDADLRQFYQDNKDLFNIPRSFRLSHIVVKTKKEAEQVRAELKDGSNFATLAMERSLDDLTASRGGALGYISDQNDGAEKVYLPFAKAMKVGTYSQPVRTAGGYAVLFLHEKLEGTAYKFADVKELIRRQLAIEQLGAPASAKSLWKEVNIQWHNKN